jgi:hypothetical protein
VECIPLPTPIPGPEAQYQVILDTLGAVQGRVSLPDSVDFAWVQIYGLSISVPTDSLGNFTIANLPVGSLRLMAWSASDSKLLAEEEFSVLAGDTLGLGLLTAPTVAMEDPSTWAHARSLMASDLISDWMRPVQFPTVVTLFLDSSNFDFSKARADGADLRVFAATGKGLVIDRARYDSLAARAEIRIRIEDASDTLSAWSFCWGKPLAIDPGHPDLWAGFSSSTKLKLNSILVDDFEDGNDRNAMPIPVPLSYWFKVISDSATITPAVGENFSQAIQPAGSGRSGKAVHILYHADSPEWVLIGTPLGEKSHSIYTMDSIEFWAKGDGNYSIAFENNIKELTGRKAWKHLVADSVWTRVAIAPSDLLGADSAGGNMGWETIRDSVTNISIFSTDGSEFWIDDIRLYGVSQDHLLR